MSHGYAMTDKEIGLYLAILMLYGQQKYMYDNRVHSVDHRIVSITQPWIQAIVRGKAKVRTSYYPERVLADQIYRRRENRNYCKAYGIRIFDPKLGRSGVNTKTDKKREYQYNRDRIEVEQTFSVSKCCYGMGCIVTKLEETQLASIASSVFVTNLFKIQKQIFYVFLHLFQYGNRYKRWSMPIVT